MQEGEEAVEAGTSGAVETGLVPVPIVLPVPTSSLTYGAVA